MKAGALTAGYTIVEVLMFLAISGVLLLIATTFINGQNQANQFGQALRGVESKISDVVNTVSSGTYQYKGSLACQVNTVSGSLDFIGSGASGQGANQACTFLGRIIQFAPQSPGADGYNIFIIAGRHLDSNGNEIGSLDTSYPTPVTTSAGVINTTGIDLTDSGTLGWGLNVTRIVSSNTHQDLAGIAVMSDFAHNSSSGTTDLLSGSQSATLVSPLGSLNQNTPSFINIIKNLSENDRSRGQEGAVICFSGNAGRKGAITVSSLGITNVLIDQVDQLIGVGVCP